MTEVTAAQAAESLRTAALEYAEQNRGNDATAAARIFAWQAGMIYAGMLHKGRNPDEALALCLMFEAAAIEEHFNMRAAVPPALA